MTNRKARVKNLNTLAHMVQRELEYYKDAYPMINWNIVDYLEGAQQLLHQAASQMEDDRLMLKGDDIDD